MIAAAQRPAGAFDALAKTGPGGRVPVTRAPRAAFTLLEILISLALVALLVGATVSLSSNLIGDTPLTVNDVFWKAMVEARKEALTSQHDVRLAFDTKTKAFLIGVNVSGQVGADAGTPAGADASAAAAAETFPVPLADKLTVDFLPTGKSTSTVLIGGELIETQSLPFVTFYSDGTCTAFRAQFHTSGEARITAIDPWTCTEVLEEKK
jgi:general secretion pathway protein H